MIERGDSIVSVSYQARGVLGGPEKTETFSLVGPAEDIAVAVAGQIENWLMRGSSGPFVLHATSPFKVVNATDAAERVKNA